MSTVSYLFGNVDEKGNLERNEANQDIKELLDQKETAEYLNKVLSTPFDFKPQDTNEEMIVPAADAVDYQDIQEMAEDITPPEILKPQFFKPNYIPVAAAPKRMPLISGRLKFSEIFQAHVEKVPQQFKIKHFVNNDDGYELEPDEVELFMKPLGQRSYGNVKQLPTESNEQTVPIDEVIDEMEEADEQEPEKDVESALASVVLDHWEEKILWSTENARPNSKPPQLRMFRNEHLDNGDWVDHIIWEKSSVQLPEFHMDDPTLVILQKEVDEIKNPDPDKMALQLYKKHNGKILDRYNISEDWKYEQKKTKLGRVRQTHGPIKLQHSLPASKLHPHYFKPLLTVKELRNFHRPTIKFQPNEIINFSRAKKLKKQKLKVVDASEMMRTPKDITLKDKSKYVLVEYSEEYPPAVQNPGMASLIYNYYRRKDEKDNFVPKMTNGGAFILESVDVSPFYGFGDVKPGQTMQVLYNNLFRVPIFEQDVPFTDFLCIRNTYRGVTKYYVREIPNIYVAGQTYPVQEVPRPQARKITQALKMRLQVAAYRLMRSDPYRRLQFERLQRQFPMFTETQIRSKLKEFAQYLKKGENTGWWKLKNNMILPDEDGIRKLVTPESICLQESTLVAQQRLKDTGYGAEDMKEVDDEENESQLDIEIQLAPWTTTKNFITAASGKGMVQLFGPGDPTGCGEGFSYIRASMKEMFFHHGETQATQSAFIDQKSKNTSHKYSIAEQQKVYKHEIERIWTNQLRSLSCRFSTTNKDPSSAKKMQRLLESENSSTAAVAAEEKSATKDDFSDAEGDDAQSVHGGTLAGKNKMLVINRLVRNEAGTPEWVSEVVTDGRVINAYLRHRKMIESPPKVIEGEEPETDLKARVKRRTYAHLVRLQVKQGKRPPLPEEEEMSESELPNELTQKPLPVVLKIPGTGEAEKQGAKRKKLSSENHGPIQIKLSTKRRTSPEVDFGEIISKVLHKLINNPSYGAFLNPVSQFTVADYYEIIKNPICLEQIREGIRNFKYRSFDAFFADIKLLVNNCEQYNGVNSPLTYLAKQMQDQVLVMLEEDKERIEKLEKELLNQDNAEKDRTEEKTDLTSDIEIV